MAIAPVMTEPALVAILPPGLRESPAVARGRGFGRGFTTFCNGGLSSSGPIADRSTISRLPQFYSLAEPIRELNPADYQAAALGAIVRLKPGRAADGAAPAR